MSDSRVINTSSLSDYATGALVGHIGGDGQEYAAPGYSIDSSGTPGNVTQHSTKGRVAVAAGASSVTVTNRHVTANSTVIAQVSQAAADTAFTSVLRVSCAAGSFTITGPANANAATKVDWVLFGQLS